MSRAKEILEDKEINKNKASEFIEETRTITNKESMFVVRGIAEDLKSVADELKFQVNQAKRDPDKEAEVLLNKTLVELFKVERIVKKARKELDI
jgi:GTP-dependent phosphoenolpyruvate carboxykinase